MGMSLHKSTKGTIVLETGFDRRGCFDGVGNTQLKPIINHCVWFPCVLSAGVACPRNSDGIPKKNSQCHDHGETAHTYYNHLNPCRVFNMLPFTWYIRHPVSLPYHHFSVNSQQLNSSHEGRFIIFIHSNI